MRQVAKLTIDGPVYFHCTSASRCQFDCDGRGQSGIRTKAARPRIRGGETLPRRRRSLVSGHYATEHLDGNRNRSGRQQRLRFLHTSKVWRVRLGLPVLLHGERDTGPVAQHGVQHTGRVDANHRDRVVQYVAELRDRVDRVRPAALALIDRYPGLVEPR